MNYTDTLKYIHSLGQFSHEAGLSRIELLCENLGNPQNSFPAIHIAGTNGKGSVAVFLAEIFKRAGYKTGLYISPYIIKFNERISVNGEYISDEDLTRICEEVKGLDVPCTEFEFITACAFKYFAECQCDIVIAETGLGGKFDATNVLTRKSAAVITKIGLDHCAVLGDTIEKIAGEKCGIIKNCAVVTSPNQEKAALDVIRMHNPNTYVPDLSRLRITRSDITGNTFIYKGKEYQTGLIGAHQIENALCVIETLAAAKFDIPYNIIYEGLKNAFIPARLERLQIGDKTFIIDGAHNPDAADRLAEFISHFNTSVNAVVGMMGDKDYNYVLKKILPLCRSCVTVRCADIPRALTAEETANTARKYCPCETAADFDDAVRKALGSDNDVTVVFGSLYLAAGIREKLKKINNL